MAVEVVMPKLGMSMKEGTVSVWNKEVGETVNKGESIASINSEKIEMEIESPAEGTILDIKVSEGEGVPPGTVICYIGEGNEPVEEKKARDNQSKPKKERKKISPVARKMANSANLDIDTLVGTGPGGRITKEDVLHALPEREEKKQNETEHQPINMMRKTIASRMMESLQTSAQLTITMKADVTQLTNLQQQLNGTAIARYDTKLTITDFVAKAAILSLLEHPAMNSQYHNGVVETFENVHLGIAALDNGLAVPVIQHAERLTLIELAKSIKFYGQKAREGKLLHDEIQGSTFTLTNLGAYGVEHFTPILNPPEAGILGVGTMYDTPVYRDDELCKGTILPLSLTFDHRVLDGAPASAFLSTVKAHLEEPISTLL